MNLRNKGFSLVEALLIVAVIGIIAFVGWRVWDASQSADTGSDVQTSEQTTAENAPAVESSEDLGEAEEFLNNTNVDEELDTSELDGVLNEG